MHKEWKSFSKIIQRPKIVNSINSCDKDRRWLKEVQDIFGGVNCEIRMLRSSESQRDDTWIITFSGLEEWFRHSTNLDGNLWPKDQFSSTSSNDDISQLKFRDFQANLWRNLCRLDSAFRLESFQLDPLSSASILMREWMVDSGRFVCLCERNLEEDSHAVKDYWLYESQIGL